MKNMIVPVAVAIVIICCVVTVSANVGASKARQALEQEQYKRIKVEEQLYKAEMTIKKFEAELSDSADKIGSIEKILNTGKVETANLENQLKRVIKEKETLQRQVEQFKNQAPPVAEQTGSLPVQP